MKRQHILYIGLPLAVNILLSWTLLPFVLPPFPFRGYSVSNFLEVLLWQGVYAFGWPFALFGIILGLLFGVKITNTSTVFIILLYPAMQILLLHSAISKMPRLIELVILNIFVTISFIVVWYYVLNGYDFMIG